MSTPLLLTKFNVPLTNPGLVRRERLLNLLDQSLQHGHILTLICAPAGYGKTTLVSQWIKEHANVKLQDGSVPNHFIWLTLDQEDNDLARFIVYLVTALQQIDASLGQGILAALQNVRSTSPRILATLLINDLSMLEGSYILILEDYHSINAQSIQDFISYLIDHQPQQIHLVIISRADPPLPLARLRARDQLTELRQHDLAMTMAETTELFGRHLGLELTTDQVQSLETKTEGWAAGLQLAMLAIRLTENRTTFIGTFSGSHEYIADYLTGEVLEQQTALTRDFLLQTSILKQLSAPLCEAVTGQAQATQILEKLVNDNIFLEPLDDRQEWYRYHALFGDLLRKRLYQSNRDKLQNLHNKAGKWYSQNGMLDQAIEHFLAGEDYDTAAGLIEKNAELLLMNGQTPTVLRWLEAFPAINLSAHPVLIVYQGVAMILSGKIPDNPLALLQEIASSSEIYQGESFTLQALYSVLKGNALEAIHLSECALQRLPEDRAFLRILAADGLAMAHTLRGDLVSGAHAFEKVVEASSKAGNVIMMLLGLTNLAGLRYQQGQLRQARDEYQRVIDISHARLGVISQPASRALLGMGELAREWNDLQASIEYLTDAIEMFKQFIDIGLSVAYLSLAKVYLSQGEWQKVQSTLEKARQRSSATKTTALDDNLTELLQARLWIAVREYDAADQWALRRGLLKRPIGDLAAMADQNATAFELLQGEYMTLVRLFIAQNQPSKSLEILDVLLSYNEQRGQLRRVIEVLVLQAIAYQLAEAGELALQAFYRALSLGEPEGYIRTFLDEGKPIARLLSEAIASGHSPLYAQNLLASLNSPSSQPSGLVFKTGAHHELVEPLSQREIEVLRLIAKGLTNQEIGTRLYISLSTVKGHTTNIYGKLGVNSRTQAVTAAQKLGLLSPD
jgi:ATP/maltotriose-dependent transcriptional regulator MalT